MIYYNRAIWSHIRESLAIMPAIFLNGPRQVGKSTMMQKVVQKHITADYVTFDDITVSASASRDPEGFLRSFTNPVIIDEVQKVPEIFPALKILIDEYRQNNEPLKNGRFILTGSVSIMAIPELSESLVGRMAIISLYPLSTIEVMQKQEVPQPVITGWFNQIISYKEDNEEFSLDKIIYKASFPEIVNMTRQARDIWCNNYINTLLQRDVRDLAEITKISFLPNMLQMLAARAGSTLNDIGFAKDSGLDIMTYRRYRILLEKVFLITLVQPWYRNINLRLVRSPKVFFTDTVLLCNQLGVDLSELKQNNPVLFGHVLENFVFSELQKQLSLLSDKYKLYYFRIHSNREEEVDFVIEKKNGSLIGIEVKSSYNVDKNDFNNLGKLKEAAREDFVRGIVLYYGKKTIPFGEDMIAMPISSLWNFNMAIDINLDNIKINPSTDCVIIWAKYGDKTRIRCDIPKEIISDFFHNHPSEEKIKKAIQEHSKMLEEIFTRKIREWQINIKPYYYSNSISRQEEKVLQVMLTPEDFDRKDFR